jgi:putative ABC transport system permease protein
VQDLRDAVRALQAAPLVSAVSILSLALGIGANTAIFSILNSLLLKPLPVREPNQLVVVGAVGQGEWFGLSYLVWKGIQERRVFDRPFAWGNDRVGVSEAGEVKFAEAIWATGDLFEVLGLPAVLGRTFDARDDRRGGGPDGPVAVIGYGFWQRRFGGAPDTIGRTLTIERVPYTIVGVTPPSFFGLNVGVAFDVILPLETEPLLGRMPQRLDSAHWTWLQIMARRASSQTPESLTAGLRGAQPGIRDETMPPFAHAEDREGYLREAWIAREAPAGVSRLRRQYGPALLTLLGVVGVVLLVACANIATLMLGRSAARRYEFSVRRALGASRGRLVRQLLAESLLLSAIGAGLGFAFARWGSRLLVAQLSTWASTAFLDLSVDWRVLGMTGAATIATALLFGTVPASGAVHVEPIEALKRHPRGLSGGATIGLGGWLVIVQVALSSVLVVGAGLFVRSFAALAYRDLGFDRSRVLVAVVDARRSAVPAANRAALYERVREAVAIVPGVESAATSMATPLGSAGVRFTPDITAPGNAGFAGRNVRILSNPVSPDWFRTFGTRILAGRDFDARDRDGSPGVVIVNEAFARSYFEGATPLGRTLVEVAGPADRRPLEIIGLVEDAAFASVREPVGPTIYKPLAQRLDQELSFVPPISVSVRALQGLSPATLTSAVAAAIGGVDRDLVVTFQTVSEQLSPFYIRERLLALLSGFFGVLALLLAGLRMYGVASYAVGRRRTEIGIRMALGANPAAVVRMVLGRVSLLAALGIIVGALASLWTTRFVSALLFSVPSRDPFTFGAAAVGLAIVAGAAGWLPARRAARIDPAVVLREG